MHSFLSNHKESAQNRYIPTDDSDLYKYLVIFLRWDKNENTFWDLATFHIHTVSDVCSTDSPKKDSTNFESQNFEGP